MRARFSLIAALVVFASVCPAGSGVAQDAKPDAKPPVAAPKPQEPKPEAPQQAAVPAAPAIPLVRLQAAGRIVRAETDLPFDLSNLVLAKFDDSPKGARLVALMEQSRTEKKVGEVAKFKTEVRTRTVRVVGADGKAQNVEQTYTVSIPFTENAEHEVKVPAGKKPTAFPLDELRIYRLDGTKVSEAEARKQLEKMSPIFLLRGFTGDIKAVEGVYLQALNPNCLIVVTEKAE